MTMPSRPSKPYCREVQAPFLPVDVMNVILDENRAAVRFLTPIDKEMGWNLPVAPSEELLSTARLAAPFVTLENARKVYLIRGVRCVVYAEIVLDKREPEYQRFWTPGSHIVFYFDPSRGLRVDPRGALTYFTMRNTAELIRHTGGVWCFDLWVRNPVDPISACNRSITTAPSTLLITNIEDLGEKQTADYVMQGGRSKWLSLAYRLTPEAETVAPDETVWFRFEVLDGKTGELASDVTWDGWQIEAVDGYAPRRRFAVERGIGKFRVKALGLLAGETLRVKVRKRWDSSVAESSVLLSRKMNTIIKYK